MGFCNFLIYLPFWDVFKRFGAIVGIEPLIKTKSRPMNLTITGATITQEGKIIALRLKCI